ncbi:MAG TPA: hypothetical protein VH044_02235 [Polyangiaceae bacterium]|jgi:hypothetical protein|nr:hypothetical protein [Polyangiaceae bacterium]
MIRFRPFALGFAFSAGVSVLACSSSSTPAAPPPCNEDPWECPTTQTCWPKDQTSFECVNVGTGAAGDACVDTLGAATCGAGLACLQTDTTGGHCLLYCDNTDVNHPCPSGQSCQTAFLLGTSGAQFHVCVATAQ